MIGMFGETEASSAGEQLARDIQTQSEWERSSALPFQSHFGHALRKLIL